jgi:hypothetical protein
MLVAVIGIGDVTAAAPPGAQDTVPVPDSIADYPFFGTLLKAGEPAVGDTVRVYDQAIAPTDSLLLITDAEGIYQNLPAPVAAPDAPPLKNAIRLDPNRNPDPSRFEIHVPGSHKDAADEYSVRVFDLVGRDVSGDRVSAGVYLAGVVHDGELLSRAKFTVADGRADLSRLETVVVSSGSAQDFVGEKSHIVRLPMPVHVKYGAEGFVPATLDTTLSPDGTVIPPVNLEQESQGIERDLRFDVWDITGDWPLEGAQIRVLNAHGEEFSGEADNTGNGSLTYTINNQGELLKVLLDYPGYTNQTGAALDTSMTVVGGGRIDAAANFGVAGGFTSPDTLTLDTGDSRLDGLVRFHYLSDEEFNDGVIRDGVGIIHQRQSPYRTIVMDHNMDADTYDVAGPTPEQTVGWQLSVAQQRRDGLTRPNGTRYNTMTSIDVESESTFDWFYENVHVLHADHTVTGGWNYILNTPQGVQTYAEGYYPPEAVVSRGLIAAESYNSEVYDHGGHMGDFINPDGTPKRSLDVALALHHLMDNLTIAEPGRKSNYFTVVTPSEFLNFSQEEKAEYMYRK